MKPVDRTDWWMRRGGVMSTDITIIVIAMGAWGKGDTYESALAKCIDEGGRQNAHNLHIVYACNDPDCNVNDQGDIEHRHDTAVTKIMALRFGRVMKPR